jgi:hypothetical protein
LKKKGNRVPNDGLFQVHHFDVLKGLFPNYIDCSPNDEPFYIISYLNKFEEEKDVSCAGHKSGLDLNCLRSFDDNFSKKLNKK